LVVGEIKELECQLVDIRALVLEGVRKSDVRQAAGFTRLKRGGEQNQRPWGGSSALWFAP
jgi:hypothetical protein